MSQKVQALLILQEQKKNFMTNVLANPFLCVESHSLYMIPTVCIFLEKEVYKVLFYISNVDHKEIRLTEGHTLAYLIPAQHNNLLEVEENNQGSVIANILAAVSEIKVEILPAIPAGRKLIFPGDDTFQESVTSRCKNISSHTRKIKWFHTYF